MTQRDQFSPGVNPGIYGSGESVGNIIFPSFFGGLPAPQNVVASNSLYTDKVLVTWSKVEQALTYKIFRDGDLLVQTQGSILLGYDTDGNTNIDTNTLYYEDTTAIAGVLYNYSIIASNSNGDGNISAPNTGSKKLTTPTLTASSRVYGDKIELSWSSVDGSPTYVIYRSVSQNLEDFREIDILIETKNLYYTDDRLSPGTVFYYSIKAKTELEESESDLYTPVLGETSFILSTPIVTASDGTYTNYVLINWENVPTATHYEIYRNGSLLKTDILETEYYDTTAIAGVIYTYQVVAKNLNLSSAYDTDGGTTGYKKLNISGVGLTATNGLYQNKIELNWNAIEGATGYEIYRGNTWIDPLNNMSLIATVGTVFTYDDTNTDLSYNTNYYYSIRAISSSSNSKSDILNSQILGLLKTPVPATPTNLSASDGIFENKVSLTWDESLYSSFYKIYRDGVFIDTSSTNSYNDVSISVIPGVSYSYTISGVNLFGDESSQSTSNTGYRKLSAPTLASASDSEFETKIVIVWGSSSGATSYQIYRGTSSNTATMSLIATVGSSVFSYDDTNTDLIVGTTYYYAIKALSALSTSEFSNVDSGILQEPTNIIIDNIVAPTNLTATTAGSNSVTLNWSYTGDPTSFRVWRNGIPIQTLTSAIRSYTDTAATPGQNISYQVSTTNRSGVNLYSNTATGSIKLSSPSSLTVSGGISPTQIDLSWPVVNGANNYTIERSINSVFFSEIATVTTTSYSDTNTDLSYNVNYYYRVKAVSGISDLESSYSNISVGYLLTPAPSSFTLTASQGTSTVGVDLSWTPSENATSYRILRDGIPIGFSPSNLLIKSENPAGNISSVYPPIGYNKYGSSIINITNTTNTLPNGSTGTFSTMSYTTGSQNSGIYQNIFDVEEDTWYNLSVYAKGTGTFRLSYYDGTIVYMSDITNEPTGTKRKAIKTRTITDNDISKDFELTTEWKRYSFVFKTTIQSSQDPKIKRIKNFQSNVSVANGSNNATPTISLWGMQLEKTIDVTSQTSNYIPTSDFRVIGTSFTDINAINFNIYSYQILSNNISGSINSNTTTGFLKPIKPTITLISQSNNAYIDFIVNNGGNLNSTLTIQRGYDSNTNNNTNDIEWLTIYNSVGDTFYAYTDTDVNLSPGVKYYYRAKVTYNGISSDYSDIDFSDPFAYGMITGLAAPTGPQDYALFCLSFHSDFNGRNFGAFNESSWNTIGLPKYSIIKTVNGNKIYNPDYPYKGMIPSVTPSISNSIIPFGGARHPTDTTFLISTSNWNWFEETMNVIPQGRRAVGLFPWFMDIGQPYAKNLHDWYTATSDGIEYNSKRFLSVFTDQWYVGAKSHFSGFVDKCIQSNLSFDYMVDNKEFMRHWLLEGGGWQTLTAGYRFGSIFDNDAFGGNQVSDSRIISAILEDPRTRTKVNPVSGKTFEEEFMYHFQQIWNADVFHGAASPPKPLPVHPSGRALVMDDLIRYIFTETSQEKIISATTGDGAVAAQSVAVSSNAYRIRPANYWTQYSCGTGAGTQEYNQLAQGCSTIMGSQNWRANWFLNFYASSYPELRSWYDTWMNPSIAGNPRITGYILHKMAAWAWNATIDSWMFNYYTRSMFMEPLRNTNNTNLNHVKYVNYEMTDISAEEKNFFHDSNMDQWYRKNIDQYCGEQLYGSQKNVLFTFPNIFYYCTFGHPIYNPSLPWVDLGMEKEEWKSSYYGINSFSGYIKKPKSDHEKYSWAGSLNKNYGGPSWNDGSNGLVRYPDIPLFDENDNWIGWAYKNGIKFTEQLVYKMLVNDVKDMRHFYKSSNRYVGWPTIGASDTAGTNFYSYASRTDLLSYWTEMIFHLFLNTKTEFIPFYTQSYSPTERTESGSLVDSKKWALTQYVLDEWRNISINRVGVPCTNEQCDPSLPIDRLVLTDAFQKCIVSGKKFEDTGTYLWRLTVAPEHYNKEGIAILDRIDDTNESNDDLPKTIKLNVKLKSFKDLATSRGIWLKRNKAGIPNYKPRIPIDKEPPIKRERQDFNTLDQDYGIL